MRQKRQTRLMLRMTTEKLTTQRASYVEDERAARSDGAGAFWWSPPEIYEKSIYYSAAMNHGTACGGGGADQRHAAFVPVGDPVRVVLTVEKQRLGRVDTFGLPSVQRERCLSLIILSHTSHVCQRKNSRCFHVHLQLTAVCPTGHKCSKLREWKWCLIFILRLVNIVLWYEKHNFLILLLPVLWMSINCGNNIHRPLKRERNATKIVIVQLFFIFTTCDFCSKLVYCHIVIQVRIDLIKWKQSLSGRKGINDLWFATRTRT